MPTSTEHDRPLTVLVGGLNAADQARVAAFLRVSSDRLRCRWVLAKSGSVDVLITDQDHPPTIPGSLDDPTVLLRVTPHPVDGDPTQLASPLQYDTLVEGLAEAEKRILGRMPRRHTAPPAAQPLKALAIAQDIDADSRYRLKRWPPADMLQSDRYGVRLASFVSSRYLTVHELAALSNVEPDDCRRFLARLAQAGILRKAPATSQGTAEADAVTLVPSDASPADPSRDRPQRRGLLAALRQKLGLSR